MSGQNNGYSPETKKAALELYAELGSKEASRRTEIPEGTLKTWANRTGTRRSGGPAAVTPNVERAVETAPSRGLTPDEAKLEQRRKKLRLLLLDRAIDALNWAGETKQHGRRQRPASLTMRNYMAAAAIAIDKFRLEAGESTSHQQIDMHAKVEKLAATMGLNYNDVMAEVNTILSEAEA